MKAHQVRQVWRKPDGPAWCISLLRSTAAFVSLTQTESDQCSRIPPPSLQQLCDGCSQHWAFPRRLHLEGFYWHPTAISVAFTAASLLLSLPATD